ncbi:TIGR02466 family protein [Pelagibacteraceae bacterium]|nr:TIGR02466 family protein [Pelagibacteraceae bacterium]
MTESKIIRIFPEPVFKYKLVDFEKYNKELSKYIYKLNENDIEGMNKSNRGGWHSQNFNLRNVNSIQYKFGLKLQTYILDAFQNLGWKIQNKNIKIKEMWAIINKKEDFNVVHTHPNCFLSAAYYVKTPKNCGKFELETHTVETHIYRLRKKIFKIFNDENFIISKKNGYQIN